MKISLQRITTKDDVELVGLLYEPESQTKKILVHVHGMAGNFYENRFLDFIAETLTANGIAFFAFNNRGTEIMKYLTKGGELALIGDAFERFEDCLLDIESSIDFVESKGFSEIHLSGHSLGAPKVAYYVTQKRNNRLKSVIFLSPADMVGLTLGDKNYEKDIKIVESMISEGRGKEMLPFILWDFYYLTADTYMSLGNRNSAVAIFNFYDANDPLDVLGNITIPVLAVMGRKDDALTIPTEETMIRLKKATNNSSKVETVILGDANHGYDNHGSELANVLCSWIKEIDV